MLGEVEGAAKTSAYDAAMVWLSECPDLTGSDREKLAAIARDMPLIADISRCDFLLYVKGGERELVLVAQSRPHSIMSAYSQNLLGYRIVAEREPAVYRAVRWGRSATGSRRLIDGGAPVIQQVRPIRGEGGRVIAALNIEANLIAHVRQKSRSSVFQNAVRVLQQMLVLGELSGVGALTPFREHDGILVADRQGVIRYASGIATEHYRKLGYMDGLAGRVLTTLNTGDQIMFRQVLGDLRCREEECVEQPYLRGASERLWIRQALPLISYRWGKPWWKPWEWIRRQPVGVLFTVHDATEDRRKERELKIKSAMIQEIHHRVKNNLQTVAAMLRMQIRRTGSDEVRQVLADSVSRIFSMAVVHEYLSREEGRPINIREVTHRIIQQTKQGILGPDKNIRIVFEGEHSLYLPARQATACALVINELVQNAVEHGFDDRNVGVIRVELEDRGDQVLLRITDDGDGLPVDFDITRTSSLGLQIVQTLVQDDLGGSLEMKSENGVQAIVRFSKQILEGEEHWNEQG